MDKVIEIQVENDQTWIIYVLISLLHIPAIKKHDKKHAFSVLAV